MAIAVSQRKDQVGLNRPWQLVTQTYGLLFSLLAGFSVEYGTPDKANSASYPQRDGQWVPAKVRWCSAAAWGVKAGMAHLLMRINVWVADKTVWSLVSTCQFLSALEVSIAHIIKGYTNVLFTLALTYKLQDMDNHGITNTYIMAIITSAKEVMFSSLFVCLFVC